MKKKIWILIAALAISVGFNLKYFVWKVYEAKIRNAYARGVADVNEQAIYLQGRNDTVSQVIAQAQQGEVVINTPKGKLILVPKEQKEVK